MTRLTLPQFVVLAVLAVLSLLAACLLAPVYVEAQQAPNPAGMNESRLHRDFRVEGESLKKCAQFNLGGLMDCGQTLVMGQPMHVALGSIAPQNGFAAGLAFVEHKNFANEVRTSYDIDGVATLSGSWRAGAYAKLYRQPGGFTYRPAPLVNLFAQAISLKRADYYGLGPDTTQATQTTFGFREQIYGASAILPTAGALHTLGVIVVGELDGRIPSLRPGVSDTIPSIETLFDDATAPGLAQQPATLQAGLGLRLVPAMPRMPFSINYLGRIDQFVAPGNSAYSFRRFTASFDHHIPLYNLLPVKARAAYYKSAAPVIQYQGPDDCTAATSSRNIDPKRAAHASDAVPCPVPGATRQLEGSIDLGVYLTQNFAGAGSRVPFYFMPTMGGSDVNGTGALSSYPDYRFRGPDTFLLRGSIEHSIGHWPIGAMFSVDEGKVGMARSDIGFSHLRHTFAAGLTLRAGGLPLVSLLFAWGGNEGHHTTASVSSTLMGGSSRPSLY